MPYTKNKKIKMKPTLKEKRHYIVFLVKTKKLDDEIKKIFDDAIINFIGILGYAKAGVMFVENIKLKNKNFAVLSVMTKYVEYVKTALTLVDNSDFSAECVGVSGTLKKSRRFLK